ncbi:MAG: ribonuclease R, partial [Prevotellaceae bacterium]|nr:ribonuclease R [Prevotellaceae bacterium]
MSRKKSKKKGADFLQKVIDVFAMHPTQTYNYKQVASSVGLDKAMRDTLIVTLDGLVMQGILESHETGQYIFKKPEERFVTGTVDMTKQGSAYIVPDDEERDDLFVSEHNLNQALHGDKVRVRIFNKKVGRGEGEVIEIIERSRRTFVGKIEVSERYAFVIVDSRNMPYDIFVPAADQKGAKNGQKVVVQITEWKKVMKSPTGEVIDVLGNSGNNDVEMHAILAEFDLPYTFPESVDNLAKRIPVEISDEERARRRDFRETVTFTIDPKDAKDFDDALSIK